MKRVITAIILMVSSAMLFGQNNTADLSIVNPTQVIIYQRGQSLG